jgi:phosphoglycerate dehydrogenase-like enzyme
MSASPNILFMAQRGELQDWFWRGRSQERAEELGYEVRLNPREGELSAGEWAELLVGVEGLLTTWGSPRLDAAILEKNSTLRIVGHVGGSVAPIVSPELFERGIRVCTANPLMARTVAEWSLMMTLVGLRRLLEYGQFGTGGGRLDWEKRRAVVVPQDSVVGIWGYGDVAKRLIEMLRPFEPREIIVYDEYLTAEGAAAEGVRKVGFDELFSGADIIHCLTGLTAANKGRVGAEQLAAIGDGGILINCGRAALIQEEALIVALGENRFTAIMDVYEVEPLAEDHPYRQMANVMLTPHNAGYGRDEYYLGAMLDEFDRFFSGRPLEMEVTQERALVMTDPSMMRRRG